MNPSAKYSGKFVKELYLCFLFFFGGRTYFCYFLSILPFCQCRIFNRVLIENPNVYEN